MKLVLLLLCLPQLAAARSDETCLTGSSSSSSDSAVVAGRSCQEEVQSRRSLLQTRLVSVNVARHQEQHSEGSSRSESAAEQSPNNETNSNTSGNGSSASGAAAAAPAAANASVNSSSASEANASVNSSSPAAAPAANASINSSSGPEVAANASVNSSSGPEVAANASVNSSSGPEVTANASVNSSSGSGNISDASVNKSLGPAAESNGTAETSNDVPVPSPLGAASCKCIGIDELEGNTLASIGDKELPYPADLGAHCEAWDLAYHPECPGETWCSKKWCYVDPCNCDGIPALPKPSTYIPGGLFQGRPVHFSYATCGAKDSYTADEAKKTAEDIANTCKPEVSASEWGSDKCRCVGIAHQDGKAIVTINNEPRSYPVEAGSMCKAWDEQNHPDCNASKPPSWCLRKWCYVDPCSCDLATVPKTSGYLPNASYQGKPIYFSYATCGANDSYTANVEDACVNQNTTESCAALPKCKWNGAECLGAELVDLCGEVRPRSTGLTFGDLAGNLTFSNLTGNLTFSKALAGIWKAHSAGLKATVALLLTFGSLASIDAL